MDLFRSSSWRIPVDMASLVFFRMAFGVMMFVGILRFFIYGWIEQFYVKPDFFFSYYGFSWVQPWPAWGLYLHFAVVGILALCIAFGLFYRVSIVLFFLGFTYIELLDKSNYLNHYYLVSLLSFLMIWMPLHRCFSIDAWRDPSIRRETVPQWVLWTLRFQVGTIYFFAGVAKISPDWLFHGQPLKIWLAARSGFPLIGPLLQESWVAYAGSWAALVFDLTVPFWLLWSRSRPFAYLAVVFFHLATAKLFFLGMFPWLMMSLAPVYFPPDWPRKWVARCRAWWSRNAESPTPDASSKLSASAEQKPLPFSLRHKIFFGFLGLFFAVQLFLPFRHYLYGGNVCWHEQGFRFSWKVMLIEKTGYIEFHVEDARSGKRWLVMPEKYLTPIQSKMMVTQPDMILQFAHWLAKRYRTKGFPDVKIRVDAYASLNGRHRQRLIDPKVDLAKQARGFAPKKWIVPLKKETPP